LIAESDYFESIKSQFVGTPAEAGYKYLFAQSHKARVKAIQQLVDFACNSLVENKNKMQGDDEDKLTIQVCNMLYYAGVQAIHEAAVGGHCDLVVRGKDGFLWLAEAKKHSSYDWLNKGFQQLSTRYSTCIPGQDHGELLIYCFTQDAKSVLSNWKKYLTEQNKSVSVSEGTNQDPLSFNSKHKHIGSGLLFYVRHKIVALYWEPKDK